MPHFDTHLCLVSAQATPNLLPLVDETWPRGYAMFLHAFSRSKEYAEGLSILTYMHYSEVEQWAGTYNTTTHEESRGEDYEAFKIRKAELLLDKVEDKFPGFRDKIKSYYVATPLSYRTCNDSAHCCSQYSMKVQVLSCEI